MAAKNLSLSRAGKLKRSTSRLRSDRGGLLGGDRPALEPAATLEEEEECCEHDQLAAESESDERFPAPDVFDR
jgi:hypothetical protein